MVSMLATIMTEILTNSAVVLPAIGEWGARKRRVRGKVREEYHLRSNGTSEQTEF